MGDIKLGLNLEFARLENQGFDWAMDHAAGIGYKYIEPMVHWGRELLSAAGICCQPPVGPFTYMEPFASTNSASTS